MRTRAAIFAAAAFLLSAGPSGAEDAAGAKLFKNHCGACHAIDAAATPRQGPNLHAVFQRQAGTLDGYKYSPGLKAAGWQWSPEQMDKWLTNPKDLVPDTFMSTYKQKDPEKRKLIVDFLSTHSED